MGATDRLQEQAGCLDEKRSLEIEHIQRAFIVASEGGGGFREENNSSSFREVFHS